MAIGVGELDLDRFERLLADAREDASDAAVPLLREALMLWRGTPLGEFSYEPWAQTEIARFEELRLTALEERFDADLALGRAGDIVGELEASPSSIRSATDSARSSCSLSIGPVVR